MAMGLFTRKKPEPEPHPHPVPEEQVLETTGPPLSHESVILLARLEGVTDRLEAAVSRLERQADEQEEGESGDKDA